MTAATQAQPQAGFDTGTALFARELPLCGLLVLDGGRRVVGADAAAELLLGTGAGELNGAPLRDLPAPLAAALGGVFESGRAQQAGTIEIVVPGRAPRVLSVNLLPVAGGLVAATLLDLRAIRELETGAARLERLASIGTLSAGMAHEIKNALVAVRTFTGLLTEQNPANELAGLATRELKRIEAIVGQMLRFGALGAPALAPLGLNDVLAHTARLVQHQLQEHRVTLRLHLDARPDRVNGDAHQLQQIFLNLFFNALDAMPAGGELTVASEFVPLPPSASSATSQLHSCVRVLVRDTGIGIAPDHLARLFETFFTTKPKGTGLGLPITRRLVKEHGGTIAVESTPGHGTTFTVLLPATDPAPN